MSNNVVLIYPDDPQYLIGKVQQHPSVEQLGFLCCISSSTSAALKGLVRYAVSDVVCRCYNSAVGKVMMAICDVLIPRGCECETGCDFNIIMLAAVRVSICNGCMELVESTMGAYAILTPHCITLHRHYSPAKECVIVMSFSTGTMMRKVSLDGPWTDSRSGVEFDGGYRQCVSRAISMVPFVEYINSTRDGLNNVYLNQAICLPYNQYHPGITLTPCYNQRPCILFENLQHIKEDVL